MPASNGRIDRAVLHDGGVSVSVLSLGAVTQDWRVPLGGDRVPVVLGFADPEAYRHNAFFMGAIVGRVANRIGGASYAWKGRTIRLDANDGANQLHGGPRGLSTVNWRLDPGDARSLRLSHVSPEGANGFPGTVAFEVVMSLNDGCLTWEMRATTDRETPISLAQHNYYNLMGTGTLRGQCLQVVADRVLQRDAQGIMTGAVESVVGGPCDFRLPRPLPGEPGESGVVDDFVLFDLARDPADPVARLSAPNGLHLRMWSDQPGAQIYTGQAMRATDGAWPGQRLGPCAGVCIEPSGYPNAVNRPEFPSVMIAPDRPWRQVLRVAIGVGGRLPPEPPASRGARAP